MSKVYGVFYNNMGQVLVGYGCPTGFTLPAGRKGPQLPGGTIVDGEWGQRAYQNDFIIDALHQEVREEFGARVHFRLWNYIENAGYNFIPSHVLDKTRVYMVYMMLEPDVFLKYVGRVQGGISKPLDPCFKIIKSEHRDTLAIKFAKYQKNWFEKAIDELPGFHGK